MAVTFLSIFVVLFMTSKGRSPSEAAFALADGRVARAADVAEQAGEPADLAVHVLAAALGGLVERLTGGGDEYRAAQRLHGNHEQHRKNSRADQVTQIQRHGYRIATGLAQCRGEDLHDPGLERGAAVDRGDGLLHGAHGCPAPVSQMISK